MIQMMTKIQPAQYIEAEVEDYDGHPLINALPKLNSPKDTAQLLNRYPTVRESEKYLPGYIRRHAMMRILDEFLYPTKAHVQLEQMISGMIRRGYLGRNIATKSYQRNLDDVDHTDFKVIARNAGNEALGSSVIGCSGTGKSTAIQAILDGYQHQAIYHSEFQHTQLVWLKLDCPHDGSARSLCIHFFRAVDDVLNTDYEDLYVKAKSSAESMLGSIARVSALHSIGILVIDEIQHLQAAASGGASKLLNFFVTLTNVIKVPVLFIGTPNALNLFSPAMRSARRASQFGSLNWERFENLCDIENNSSQKSEWDRFLDRLWKLQWFKSPTPLTTPIKTLFWEYTQGIAHIAVSLFYLCQARAVMAQREVIDITMIRKVFNEELSLIHPMIKALQSGRKSEIEKYSDLDLPTETVIAISQSHDEVQPLPPVEETEKDKLTELIEMLIKLNIGDDIAPIVARQAVEEKPNEDIFGLLAHIKALEDKPDTVVPKKTPPVALIPVYQDQDLRLLRDDDAMTTYNNLKKEGLVIDITCYL